jgi:hypothetical protein
MPVVFRQDGLRYFFYSNKGMPREPRHVHVEGGSRDAKIWLEPEVSIEDSYGFNPSDLSRILRVVNENRERLLRAWGDYFGDRGAL